MAGKYFFMWSYGPISTLTVVSYMKQIKFGHVSTDARVLRDGDISRVYIHGTDDLRNVFFKMFGCLFETLK